MSPGFQLQHQRRRLTHSGRREQARARCVRGGPWLHAKRWGWRRCEAGSKMQEERDVGLLVKQKHVQGLGLISEKNSVAGMLERNAVAQKLLEEQKLPEETEKHSERNTVAEKLPEEKNI